MKKTQAKIWPKTQRTGAFEPNVAQKLKILKAQTAFYPIFGLSILKMQHFPGDSQNSGVISKKLQILTNIFQKLKHFSQNSSNFFKNSRILAQKLNEPELLSPVKFQSDV